MKLGSICWDVLAVNVTELTNVAMSWISLRNWELWVVSTRCSFVSSCIVGCIRQ